MRCAAAVTVVAGAYASSTAFVAPAAHGKPHHFLSAVEKSTEGAPATLLSAEGASSSDSNSSGSFSSAGLYCAAAFAALSAASSFRHRSANGTGKRALGAFGRAKSALVRHADEEKAAAAAMGDGDMDWLKKQSGDYQMAWKDPKTGQKNYVNPWEERVEADSKLEMGSDRSMKSVKRFASGQRYHEYNGPVYKQVPVYEGVQFPLDPKMYYPPLEPPAPGAKWGDGRDADGNWYMDIDGQKTQYWQGVGRRKTACAIVRIIKGDGQFMVNNTDAIEYFQGWGIHWLKAIEPLAAMTMKNEYDCICKVFGGGKSGQAGAIRLGVARAIQEQNFEMRPLLKKAKYLTRDWRTVESKKIGKPKARKSKPYHKR
eukprot:TRINITY_DN1065_c0_g1_i1.p1 TRINITY_DN1065_c0_g1~~TRINITY_DN1065_c0_g1_i1.p1  ORF type:complete len:371 (-),score=113.97 TRINITY_DN1065_c0_g1_i1:94-1206(-)